MNDCSKCKFCDIDYIFDEEGDSVVWDTNNPTDDTPIQPPAEIQFATDEEVQQAIQAIIDSYEEGGQENE